MLLRVYHINLKLWFFSTLTLRFLQLISIIPAFTTVMLLEKQRRCPLHFTSGKDEKVFPLLVCGFAAGLYWDSAMLLPQDAPNGIRTFHDNATSWATYPCRSHSRNVPELKFLQFLLTTF